MDGVRTVARIFAALGAIGMVAAFAVVIWMASLLSGPFGAGGVGAAMVWFVAAAVSAVGPFFTWALLTVLCEIHEQDRQGLITLRNIERRLAGTGASSDPVEMGTQGAAPSEIAPEDPPSGIRMKAIRAVSIFRGEDHPKGSAIAWVPVNGKVEVLSRHGQWVRVKGAGGIKGVVDADALVPLEG